MTLLRKHQEDLEQAVLIAKTVMTSEDVQFWVTTPVPAWGNRSPMRVILDGEKQIVMDSLQQQRKFIK